MNKLPTGWQEMLLAEIITKSQYGLSLSASPIGKVPMLRMNNLAGGRLTIGDLIYVSLSEDELEKYKLKLGDILFNRTNSYDLVGKTALFEESGDYVFASYLVRFRVNIAIADPNYVCYVLNSESGQKRLKALATKGVSQSNINPTILQNSFFLSLPPLAEQKLITATLKKWDCAIEKLQALIAAKTQYKRGLMQQLFTGQKRFPEFVIDKGKQPTKYGSIPNGWNYVHISEIASEVSAKNNLGKDLTVLSCTKHYGLVDSLKYFGKRIFSDDTSTYKLVKRGQFAYATNHIEEGSIGYQDLYDEALISPMYTVFETSNRVDDSFLFKLLKTELYRHIFESNTSGSIDRRGGLRWADFATIKIPLPSVAEQQKIAAVLKACDREIRLLNDQLTALKKQKQGLMQKLLTGQIRVKVDGETLPAEQKS